MKLSGFAKTPKSVVNSEDQDFGFPRRQMTDKTAHMADKRYAPHPDPIKDVDEQLES